MKSGTGTGAIKKKTNERSSQLSFLPAGGHRRHMCCIPVLQTLRFFFRFFYSARVIPVDFLTQSYDGTMAFAVATSYF